MEFKTLSSKDWLMFKKKILHLKQKNPTVML